jgi:REP element-mobilizing transposase RayT
MAPMSALTPLYTADNCRPAYQLNWGLTVFWRRPIENADWLADLKKATEPDGVRVLEHCFREPGMSQFLVSTRPTVTSPQLVRSVKGRLQYLVRRQFPSAFRRHYGLRSVGSVGRAATEEYVRSQAMHHPMADPRVQATVGRLQIDFPEVDLSQPRRSGHGQFWYNLHVVFVHKERWCEIREPALARTRETILATARKHAHLLSAGGIVPDHIHLTLGGNWEESPAETTLCYMNNLAYAAEMKPVFKFGFYVGAFGEYDLGAIRL